MLSVIAVIVAIVVVIVVHELCHAIVMDRHGIEIEKVSIGVLPNVCSFGPFSHPKILGGADFYITPFLIGAYVKAVNEKELERLSFSQKVEIYSAGVMGNLFLATLAFLTYSIRELDGIVIGDLIAVAIVGVIVVTRLIKRVTAIFDSVVIPLLGMAFVVFLFHAYGQWIDQKAVVESSINSASSISTESNASREIIESADEVVEPVSGPVGAVKSLKDEMIDLSSFFKVVMIISISVAWINMLPLFPMDGGRIVSAIFEKCGLRRINTCFTSTTPMIVLLLIGYVLLKDVYNLIF
ncbi:M50 family metallopeptidase [Patescibacteria group bacterium]